MVKIVRKSKVQRQSRTSVRTTIPLGVAEQLELTVGDRIQWTVDISNEKNPKVTVIKVVDE